MRVLILGGTTEASALARMVAGDERFAATLSLAGRTRAPAAQPIACRVGGFGGAAGLSRYLRTEGVGAVVDATHPFAATISRNAAEAAETAGVALLGVLRPAWRAVAGDRWTVVADMAAAAAAIGGARRVLLTVGQQELGPFMALRGHEFVVRSVDPPAVLPTGARVITARGPFLEEEERRLLLEHGIEVLVTKNSGGAATRAKLDAARELGIAVVMVDRPAPAPGVTRVDTAAEAFGWLVGHAGTRRGA